VFSQFVMTGKVLGCMLGLLQKKFVYLYGTMSDGQRKNALDHFENKPEVKVLVSCHYEWLILRAE
jgi:SNF2 family DNA or RNA helicase